ncbi:MAG: hypothetical protein NZ869_07530 [Thermoanaerobaculum sp.]|nr:hypothetical protein [Thermoanaerobaculum sp.]MDW7966565.1 hypothetical protein [Thermoanaerobaculum sp.]
MRTREVGMEHYEPKSGLVALVGVVSAVVLVAVILLLQAYYYRSFAREEVVKAVMVPGESKTVRAEHLGQLEGYRVVDPVQGIVAIPIDRAMDLVLAEQGRR